MPATQIEFHHGHESLDRIINLRHWQQSFRMGHEAADILVLILYLRPTKVYPHFVIRSNMDLGSRMKVGKTTRLRSAPGRN